MNTYVQKLSKDKEHLVLNNLNLIHWVLRNKMCLQVGHPNYEDYYQEGCIGLIISAIRFDENRGFKFATFTVPNIWGCIQRYKRDCEVVMLVSRKLKDVVFRVIMYSNQGYTLNEIEEITGIKASDISDALNATIVQSIYQPIANKTGGTTTLESMIASNKNCIEEILDEEHILGVIQTISNSIEGKTHKAIWEEYIYSLFYGEKVNQEYLAQKYKFSQAQVSRLLKRYKENFARELCTR